MKTNITQSPKFQAWLETQKVSPERDYEVTSYNRLKSIIKTKKYFYKSAVIILIAIYVTIIAVIVF